MQLRNRLAHLKLSVEAIDAPNAALRASIQSLETQLDDADLKLNGDRTVSGRNEPAPWSIRARVSQVRGWGWQSQSPATGSSKNALAIAKTDLDTVLDQMRGVEAGISSVEDQLEALGAPFTPGSGVPSWTLED